MIKPKIILENPKYSGNIGMICRLVANFDLSALRIVGEQKTLEPEMEWMAYNSTGEIERIEYFDSIEEATSDIDFIIGTGMQRGKNRGEFISLSNLQKKIADTSFENLGFIFGREDKGLSNSTIDICNYMIDFELSKKQPSMNLSNSVAYLLGSYFNQNQIIENLVFKKEKISTQLFKQIIETFEKMKINEFHLRENLAAKRMRKILDSGIESKHDINFLFMVFQTMKQNLENKNEEN